MSVLYGVKRNETTDYSKNVRSVHALNTSCRGRGLFSFSIRGSLPVFIIRLQLDLTSTSSDFCKCVCFPLSAQQQQRGNNLFCFASKKSLDSFFRLRGTHSLQIFWQKNRNKNVTFSLKEIITNFVNSGPRIESK